MLMGVESLKLRASFRQKFPYPKQRLWQISLLLNPGVVCWDIRPPQILESFVWISRELLGQETVTLLMVPSWEDSKQNTPVYSRELESLKIIS